MATKFNYRKAVQVVNCFINKSADKSLNKLKLIKLVWAADRLHLRRYGRPIAWDSYVALPLGPVASATANLLDMSSFLAENEKTYLTSYINPVAIRDIRSVKAVETKVFSQSDIAVLDEIWTKLGSYTTTQLVDFSHKFPEWKRFKESLKIVSREIIDMHDFFDGDNAEGSIFYVASEALQTSKEHYNTIES